MFISLFHLELCLSLSSKKRSALFVGSPLSLPEDVRQLWLGFFRAAEASAHADLFRM